MRFFERGVQNGGGLWSHVQHRSFGLHESRRSVVAMKCPSTFFYDLMDNDTSRNLRILFIVMPASASTPGPANAHRWPAYRYSGPRLPPSLGHWRFRTLLINFKTLWMNDMKGSPGFPKQNHVGPSARTSWDASRRFPDLSVSRYCNNVAHAGSNCIRCGYWRTFHEQFVWAVVWVREKRTIVIYDRNVLSCCHF